MTLIVVQYLAPRKKRRGEDQAISKPAGTGRQAPWGWRLRRVPGIFAPFGVIMFWRLLRCENPIGKTDIRI